MSGRAAAADLRVSYFYDIALPSRYAAAIQILNTCRALGELGVPVTLYSGPIAAPTVAAALAGYGLTPHPALRIVPFYAPPWRRFTLQRRLARIARDAAGAGRHVVISRGEPGIDLFDRLRRLGPAPGRRFVYEAHRLCYPLAGDHRAGAAARLRARERAAVEGADGLVCLTEGVRAALAREFRPVAPALVLPSGTAPAGAEGPGDDARDIDILYAGKLERRKGVHDLIAALRSLPGRRLWIVGGTPEQIAELRDLAGRQGVAGRVVFTGFVEPARVRPFYDRAKVGVCPLPVGESAISEHFTSPLKVVEMMAAGVPIVGTAVPALRELLDHDRNALLAPPSDPPGLARAVATLLDDRQRAGRLARAARADAGRYSWQRRAGRLLEFLRALP